MTEKKPMRVGTALAYGYFGQYLIPILPRLEKSLKMEYETNGDRWNCLNKDLKILPKMVTFLPKQIVYEVGCGRNISALTCMSSILTYKDTNQPVYVEIECDVRKYHLALNIMSLFDGEEIVAFMEVQCILHFLICRCTTLCILNALSNALIDTAHCTNRYREKSQCISEMYFNCTIP